MHPDLATIGDVSCRTRRAVDVTILLQYRAVHVTIAVQSVELRRWVTAGASPLSCAGNLALLTPPPLAPLRPATIDGHLHGTVIERRVGAAVVLVDVTVAVVVESVAPPGRRRRDARLKSAAIFNCFVLPIH